MKYRLKKSPIMEKIAEMQELEKTVKEAIEVINNWIADMTYNSWYLIDNGAFILCPIEKYDSEFRVKVSFNDTKVNIEIFKITGYTYSVIECKSRGKQ